MPLVPAPTQTTGRNVAEIPTLFRLGEIESSDCETAVADDEFDASDESTATARRNSVRQSSVRQNSDRLLRIDAADTVGSPKHSGDPSVSLRIQQRLSRLLDRSRRRPRSSRPPKSVHSPAEAHASVDDLLGALSGDLITQLGVWSLKLDRREADLDQRERELNARLRVWRQIQSHGPCPDDGTLTGRVSRLPLIQPTQHPGLTRGGCHDSNDAFRPPIARNPNTYAASISPVGKTIA